MQVFSVFLQPKMKINLKTKKLNISKNDKIYSQTTSFQNRTSKNFNH